MGEKLFELFCIKNDFAKYFSKCYNLFKYFVSHIMILFTITRFCTTGQTKFPCVECYKMLSSISKSNRK